MWKVGNTAVGQRAAVSHTANLTEEYDFYRDAFREGGFVEIREVYDLVDAAKVFRSGKRPRGRRAAIVTTSGGAGVLLADRCEEVKVELPPLTRRTLVGAEAAAAVVRVDRRTRSISPPRSRRRSPSSRRRPSVVLADDNVDLAIVRSFPGRDVEPWADNLVAYAGACAKPILVSLSGTPAQAAAWAPRARRGGRAVLRSAEPRRRRGGDAVRFRRARAEGGRGGDRSHRAGAAISTSRARPAVLDEDEAKRCLEAYGIATPRRIFVDAAQPYPERIDLRFPSWSRSSRPTSFTRPKRAACGCDVGTDAVNRRTLDEIRASVAAHVPGTRTFAASSSKRWRKASR